MAYVNNFVYLNGILTRDPELKYSAAGTAWLQFQIAVSRLGKTKEGGGKPTTDYHNCVAFGKTAEELETLGRKGSIICVFGTLQTNSYTDKDGQLRKSSQVAAAQVNVLKNYKFGDEGELYPDIPLPKNSQTPAEPNRNSNSYPGMEPLVTPDDFPFF